MTLDKCGTGSEVTVTGGAPAGQEPRRLLVHDPAACPESHYLMEPGPGGPPAPVHAEGRTSGPSF